MARAKKRADGRYAVTLTVGKNRDGRPMRKTFYSRVSMADAKRQRDEWMNTHNYGGDGAPTPKIDGSIRLDKWIEQWLASYKSALSENSKDFYATNARCFANYERDGIRYGDMPLSDFLPIHVSEYIHSLTGCSKSKIRASKTTVKQIFDAARKNSVISRDVCIDISDTITTERVAGTYRGHKALPREMIDLICANYHKHRAGLMVMLMIFSGMRNGEALGLQWEDCDFERGVINVRQAMDIKHGTTKGTKTEAGRRTIPMFAPLRKALLRNRKPTGYVCERAGGGAHTDNSMKAAFDSFRLFVEMILNDAGENTMGFRVDRWLAAHPGQVWKTFDYTLYDFRITFATTCYDAGVDIKTAQKYMGHADATTTLRIYTKLSEEREAKSSAQMEDFIGKTYAV